MSHNNSAKLHRKVPKSGVRKKLFDTPDCCESILADNRKMVVDDVLLLHNQEIVLGNSSELFWMQQ